MGILKRVSDGFFLCAGMSVVGFICGGLLMGAFGTEDIRVAFWVCGVFSFIGFVRFIQISVKGWN